MAWQEKRREWQHMVLNTGFFLGGGGAEARGETHFRSF